MEGEVPHSSNCGSHSPDSILRSMEGGLWPDGATLNWQDAQRPCGKLVREVASRSGVWLRDDRENGEGLSSAEVVPCDTTHSPSTGFCSLYLLKSITF